jgi:GT2 family glycosyltransferase
MAHRDLSEIQEVDVVLGAFMLVRRETIEDVGALDESFFMYSEEVDWCYRMKEQGWRVYYVPLVEAIHVGGGSVNQVKADMVLELYRSRIAFFRRHYGRLNVRLYKLLLAAASVPRLLLLPFGCLAGGEASGRARTLWKGYWSLCKALPSL